MSENHSSPIPAARCAGESPQPWEAKHAVNGNSMLPPFPEGMQMAIFGMGCFWGVERMFWKLPGVFSTQVGYAGGFTPNPTYKEICTGLTGHAEVVRVVYDPRKISYEDLLKVFWENHDPTQGMRQEVDVGTQYRSVIHTFGAQQRDAALRSKAMYQQAGAGQTAAGAHHHGYPGGRGVLLRRGLPPAVPAQDPQGTLQPKGDRSGLSHRPNSRTRVMKGECLAAMVIDSRERLLWGWKQPSI
ncbi:peptide methionine sulfoxide reductase MsrA-like isoform X2 [Emydura macquarii macquarii]|uniref:peptide methionine sulfoxide reductase MsrA-like isoform X2 n=1 Tax=Emydura macquarii macquarii TaxID=1129001 RepID=UPI00352A1E64